jgi:hypothetical protein
MRQLFIFLIAINLVCSCGQPDKENNKGEEKKDSAIVTKSKALKLDTLYKLLKTSINKDSTYFYEFEPFLYLKTGYFLSQKIKTALLIYKSSDSINCNIELYKLDGLNWTKTTDLKGIDGFAVMFYEEFKDFDFDGQTDIYLNVVSSNGYSLSRGHILTVDPKTLTLKFHPESYEFKNIDIDPKTKTITSEDLIYCGPEQERNVCVLKNKWVDGKIKTIKRDCPCKPN